MMDGYNESYSVVVQDDAISVLDLTHIEYSNVGSQSYRWDLKV